MSLKVLRQTSQEYGRVVLPQINFMCLWRLSCLVKKLQQFGHWKIFFKSTTKIQNYTFKVRLVRVLIEVFEEKKTHSTNSVYIFEVLASTWSQMTLMYDWLHPYGTFKKGIANRQRLCRKYFSTLSTVPHSITSKNFRKKKNTQKSFHISIALSERSSNEF